ncbi:MAG: PQQ-dependent sugar dehydrogenase [Phycisphaerales bacterium JB039]
MNNRNEIVAALCAGGLCLAGPALAQAPDPEPSSKALQLTTFATFTTAPGSGAIDLDHPKDGSGRVFVSTNEGKIHGFSAAGDPLGVFLDLGAAGVAPDLRRTFRLTTNGLSYIAFHPEYAVAGAAGEGKLYTMYMSTVPGLRAPDYSGTDLPTRPGDTRAQYVLAEWTVDAADPDRIDPASRREVLRIEFSGRVVDSHSVGALAFNPFAAPGDADYGTLYIPLGDMNNGSGNPNWQHVQDRDNPFGKILRINPLAAGADPYSVPADNPYADGGPLLDDDGNAEEIAAWGFRNPQNLSFAKDAGGAGRLIVFDIGNEDFEELTIVDLADNHGWTRYDGPADGNPDTILRLPPGSTLEWPAAAYDHTIPNTPGAPPTTEPSAIVGGFVAGDPADPDFQNQVIFGDLPRGAFFHADFDEVLAADAADIQAPMYVMNVTVDGAGPGSFRDLLSLSRGDPRFGVDESGRLFVISRQLDTVFVTNMVADQQPDALCPADCDEDGALTFFDFLCFQNLFAMGDPGADCDGDGELTFFDFLCFQNAFAAGCS